LIHIDTFSGIGGFCVAADWMGWETVATCEKDDFYKMPQIRSDKYENSVTLYNSGMSIEACAKHYNISRQATHAILKRRGCIFRSNLNFGEDNRFHRGVSIEDSSKKKRCQHLVEKAVKNGILVNPQICETCNEKSIFKNGRTGIQAHHCDYNKPLEVKWLCQKCHHEWHKTFECK